MLFETFFQDYASGYVRQAPEEIAGFFHFPVIVRDQRAAIILHGKCDLDGYLAPFLERLAANGCASAEVKIKESGRFGGDQAICLVAYQLQDGRGRTFLDFDYFYHLADQAGEWGITFASVTAIR